MRYIIYLLIATSLFACKKSAQTSKPTGTTTTVAAKTYGNYKGYITYHSFKTIRDTATYFDTAFATTISVTALTGDSIAVYITPYNSTFRINYEGHNTSSGWSFISHPGGTEYWIKYNPDTDSATFYYKTYNTTYVKPVNADGYNYTFKGKKE